MKGLKVSYTQIRYQGITIWQTEIHDKEDNFDYPPLFTVYRLRDPHGQPFHSSSLLVAKLAILNALHGKIKGWRIVSWQ